MSQNAGKATMPIQARVLLGGYYCVPGANFLTSAEVWTASLFIDIFAALNNQRTRESGGGSEDTDFIHLFLLFCCRSRQIRNPQGNCSHSSPLSSDRCKWHNRPPNPESRQTGRSRGKMVVCHVSTAPTWWAFKPVGWRSEFWRRGWDKGPGLRLTFPPLTWDSGSPSVPTGSTAGLISQPTGY